MSRINPFVRQTKHYQSFSYYDFWKPRSMKHIQSPFLSRNAAVAINKITQNILQRVMHSLLAKLALFRTIDKIEPTLWVDRTNPVCETKNFCCDLSMQYYRKFFCALCIFIYFCCCFFVPKFFAVGRSNYCNFPFRALFGEHLMDFIIKKKLSLLQDQSNVSFQQNRNFNIILKTVRCFRPTLLSKS